jgi:hypothetical protein
MWCLNKLESLPNPNPRDYEDQIPRSHSFQIGGDDYRAHQKKVAQNWAGLAPLTGVTLLVFVGRWSHQKGIDLIADLAPRILDRYQNVQMICVGPIIDVFGRLAALKLAKTADLYPGRLYSKPEFTAVPKYVFEACDFVLIPSRDEPFGLVAVEFGRSGALGIGSYVGGLGSMPGWWFPIESSETGHLQDQFWISLELALNSSWLTRLSMRKTSLLQRFPVSNWLSGLKTLYSRVIENNADTVYKITAHKDCHPEPITPLPKSRELLIRSGLPELTYSRDVKILQEKIELYQAEQSRESLVNECAKEDEVLKSQEPTYSIATSSFIKAVINATDVEDSCDFKLLSLGNMSPLMIGSLRFKTKSSCESLSNNESFSNKNGSEVNISTLFDSVSLDAIRKDAIYTVKSFEQFSDQDGQVTAQYKLDLAKLNSHNSIEELCIAETIRNAERAYFWTLR